MKNKLNVLIIFLISFVIVGIKANASTYLSNQEPYYSDTKEKYEAGISKTSIDGKGNIIIYGKSTCNGTSCNNEYVNGIKEYEKVLQQSVTCKKGEKYITAEYLNGGKPDPYIYSDSANTVILNGTAYWIETYTVTCVANNTGNNAAIEVDKNGSTGGSSNGGTVNNGSSNGGSSNGGSSNGGSSNGGTVNNGSSNGGSSNGGTVNNGSSNGGSSNGGTVNNGSSNGGSSNDNYGSSSTVDSSQTGVSTYFIILTIVATISYVVMNLVKKHNVFKKI